MRKVAFVTTGLELGGAEMMLYKLLAQIDRQQFEPTVISLAGRGRLAEPIESLGIAVHDLGMRTGAGVARGMLRLWRCLHEIKPSVIQGWMVHGNFAALFGGIATRTPVFWGVRHSDLTTQVEKRSTVLLERFLAPFSWVPRHIVYNSRAGRTWHEGLGYASRRGIVVPNGFDLNRFRPNGSLRSEVRRELHIRENDVVIGLFARFHPMKDHATFLEAISALRAEFAGVKVILAGEGCDSANEELSRMIADRSLRDTVIPLGARRDIERLTAVLDIAANSSRSGEGFANAIGEAMACGVPCVATDVGDAARIVANCGEIVPPRDANAFSRALHRMILLGTDGRRELGLRARTRIAERFSIDAVTKEYEALYRGEC